MGPYQRRAFTYATIVAIGGLIFGLDAALISGTVEIDRLAVDGLYARMVSAPEAERVDTSGMNDRELDAFYAARREMPDQAASSAGAALALPLALNVGELLLSDARFESIDATSGARGSAIETSAGLLISIASMQSRKI